MDNQTSFGRKVGLLGTTAALTAALAIPAAVSAQDESAKVRVLHGVGDAPAVDVYANGEELIDALAFASITDYAEVPAGTYLIQVVPDGATIEAVSYTHLTLPTICFKCISRWSPDQ